MKIGCESEQIKNVAMKYGTTGVGLTVLLLRNVQKKGYLKLDDETINSFSKKYHVGITYFYCVIKKAVEFCIFDKRLYENEKILTSATLQKFYYSEKKTADNNIPKRFLLFKPNIKPEMKVTNVTKKEIEKILAMYAEICVSFPQLRKPSEGRKKAIKTALSKNSIEDFQTLFEKTEKSNFLKGENMRHWKASFDWMLKPANMAHILEGNFDNPPGVKNNEPAAKKEESTFMKLLLKNYDKE